MGRMWLIVKQSLSRTLALALAAGAMLFVTGCAPAAESSKLPTVRIGYFANITHAPAMIAREQQLFEQALEGKATVEYTVFSAGPSAIEAMRGRAVDVAYVGPNPAVTGYIATDGTLLSIVSGATSGGAKFVVRRELAPAVESKPTRAELDRLRGGIFASPQLGGTQDVALRNYLRIKKIATDGSEGSALVSPSDNSTTLTLFQKGQVDGAWVPEPWATRLVQEAGAKVFIDEAALWPGGQFVTTNLVASKPFIKSHPALLSAVLKANNAAIAFLNEPAQHDEVIRLVQKQLKANTGKELAPQVIESAWPSLKFSASPNGESLAANFGAAVKVGHLLGYFSDDIRGIYDLRALNSLRKQDGLKPFSLPDQVKAKE